MNSHVMLYTGINLIALSKWKYNKHVYLSFGTPYY